MLTSEDLQLLIAGFLAIILYSLWPFLKNRLQRVKLQKKLRQVNLFLKLKIATLPESTDFFHPDMQQLRPLSSIPEGTAWVLYGTRQTQTVLIRLLLENFVDPYKPRSRRLWKLTAQAVWKSGETSVQAQSVLKNRSLDKGLEYPLANDLEMFQKWFLDEEKKLFS